MEKERILKNICTYPQVIGITRHKSVPRRYLMNIKQIANSTQMNFTEGLKFPSAKGMKSIGDDSAEDNVTNHSNNEERSTKIINDPHKTDLEHDGSNINYHTDREDVNKNSSLGLVQKMKRRQKRSKKKYKSVNKSTIPKIRPFPTS